jgi:hypothetical protein
LEELNFTRGNGGAVLEETFDSDGTALEGAFVNNGTLGAAS